ncbi:hypothetical protein SAMN04488128_102559 [Chitinophaga eiseniae]|uniref:Uncharacterized protein n=1 Tax=Chitinophaga eiseniae TaxID=634771 RepID=A0A1T4QS79_9BACT|nr:hypothetical protein SAMN04488128_102559 [Chitinophaga eiseniae]
MNSQNDFVSYADHFIFTLLFNKYFSKQDDIFSSIFISRLLANSINTAHGQPGACNREELTRCY